MKTGSLYHVQDSPKQLPKDDEWFTEHIIVKGNKHHGQGERQAGGGTGRSPRTGTAARRARGARSVALEPLRCRLTTRSQHVLTDKTSGSNRSTRPPDGRGGAGALLPSPFSNISPPPAREVALLPGEYRTRILEHESPTATCCRGSVWRSIRGPFRSTKPGSAARPRQVTHLHPALRPPAHELDFVGAQVRRPHDRRRPVVLLDALVDDEPRSRKSFVIGVPGYGVGCWMYGQST